VWETGAGSRNVIIDLVIAISECAGNPRNADNLARLKIITMTDLSLFLSLSLSFSLYLLASDSKRTRRLEHSSDKIIGNPNPYYRRERVSSVVMAY